MQICPPAHQSLLVAASTRASAFAANARANTIAATYYQSAERQHHCEQSNREFPCHNFLQNNEPRC